MILSMDLFGEFVRYNPKIIETRSTGPQKFSFFTPPTIIKGFLKKF